MKASDFFTKTEQSEITKAIAEAEKETSGEVRVHIEKSYKGDVLDRAANIFAQLKMHKTELRNGVLFYLDVEEHKFAVIGDIGINQVVPDGFWDCIKDTMAPFFSEGKFSEGLIKGIIIAGNNLKTYFPYKKGDVNELSNEISYGK